MDLLLESCKGLRRGFYTSRARRSSREVAPTSAEVGPASPEVGVDLEMLEKTLEKSL
jgi:hypothetical protein